MKIPGRPRFILVPVGGIGKSELGELTNQVLRAFPGTVLIDLGEQNEYLKNVVLYVEQFRREWFGGGGEDEKELPVVLIGHSLGAWKVVTALHYLTNVLYAVAIDPVKPKLSDRIEHFPKDFPVSRFDWFRRGLPGIEVPMDLEPRPKDSFAIPNTTHAELPRSPVVIAKVVKQLTSLLALEDTVTKSSTGCTSRTK
jgi:pimeloyl-ACP methyl ester carboxylesterase